MSHTDITKSKQSPGSTGTEGARAGVPKGRIRDTCIVFACDDAYGMPLATAIRSIVEINTNLEEVAIYVLASGVTGQTRRRVEASAAGFDVRLHWLEVDLTAFSSFGTLPYASKTTFARLRIPEVLPSYIRRVLYLDADVLVLQNLQELLRTDLNDGILGAVLDGMETRREAGYQRLNGVPDVEAYFNAGVLLIDLERWKQSAVSQRALQFLEQNPATPYADQDALNVACDGCWNRLEEKWNFQRSADVEIEVCDPSEQPAILHFVTANKPWLSSTRNRNAALYDRIRSRTAFSKSVAQRRWDDLTRAYSLLKRSIKKCAAGRAMQAWLRVLGRGRIHESSRIRHHANERG